MRHLVGLVSFLIAFGSAHAQATGRERGYDVPIHVEAPTTIRPFRADDGRLHLSYHALVTNWGRAELVVDRLEILDGANGRVIAAYDTIQLRQPALLHVNVPDPPRRETVRRLASGRTALLRTWVTLDSATPVPARIVHRFTFAEIPTLRIARTRTDTASAPVVTCAPMTVDPAGAVVISPPLRGGPWAMSGGAGPRSYHLGFATIDGRTRLAEMFAVDFQKVDSAGNILPNPFPDTINNAMFYSNRADVLAVADGEVIFVQDGIPENVPTPSGDENMPIPLTRESTGGNQIGLRLANGLVAQYAHLVPGSLRVKVGDRVRRGQVIAVVGNSGNSKNPHLHFGIADGPRINAAQGHPWVFAEYEWFGKRGPQGMPDVRATPQRRRNEIPTQDAIVRFR